MKRTERAVDRRLGIRTGWLKRREERERLSTLPNGERRAGETLSRSFVEPLTVFAGDQALM